MNKKGRLFLIPVPVSDEGGLEHISPQAVTTCLSLNSFIAEDPKTCRRHLKLFGHKAIQTAEITELNEHSRPEDIPPLLNSVLNGIDTGLMSEAGCPGIADPGAELIQLAHQKGIEVIPLAGPSAVTAAIMSSGFSGQNFAFIGYLPQEQNSLRKRLRELEKTAKQQGQAQFFIETPYRNKRLAEQLLGILSPDTRLYVGVNLFTSGQFASSRSVQQWKKDGLPELHKMPAVFGIF